MKTSLYLALVILSSSISLGVHAIPPALPAPIVKMEQETVTCKDLNALTVEEIAQLNEDSERIVSVDLDIREICFK